MEFASTLPSTPHAPRRLLASALGAMMLSSGSAAFAANDADAPRLDQPIAPDGSDAEGRRSARLDQVEVNGAYVDSKPASPKYTQPLVDTPQSISVIPSQVYQQQGQTSLRDVLRNTPGITFQAGEGGSAPGDNLFVRGFAARNDVFIDGIRDPGVVSRDTFNVDAVEVSKGPASAITGRGSTGGSVNIVTKSARADDFTTARVTIGNADYKRTTFDLNEATDSGVALRLNGVWTDAGVPGRDEVNSKNWGIAPSFVFGLGSSTQATFNYQHMQQNNLPDYGLPATLPANVPAGTTVRDIDLSNFYGLVHRDYEHVNSDAATIILDHTFNDHVALRNITRYGQNARDAVVTPPRAAAAPAANTPADPGYDPTLVQIRRTDTKYQDRDDRIIANQTNVTLDFDTGAMKHAVVTGLEFSREESTSWTRVDDCAITGQNNCPRPPVTDLFDPDPFQVYDGHIHRNGAYGQANADDVAAYAFDTLELSPQWQLSGGARWESFKVDYTGVAAPAAGASGGVVTKFNREDENLSYRAGLVYKPVKSGSLYVAYGTSFSPSADGSQGLVFANNATGTTGANSPSLAPEKSKSMEGGTKWELVHEKLFVTAAVFKTEKTNAKTTDASGNTVLAGNQKVDGVELGISGSLTDAWSLYAGYAYMHSKIDESLVPAEVDRELPFVPKQTANLWSAYQVTDKFSFGAGAQFNDGYYFTNNNLFANPNLVQIGKMTKYTIFNAMAAYAVNDHLNLQLNVNNLTDKDYVERGYQGHFTPGAARAVLLSADVKF
jgi:catecholate siderophore receptor